MIGEVTSSEEREVTAVVRAHKEQMFLLVKRMESLALGEGLAFQLGRSVTPLSNHPSRRHIHQKSC